jgi:hypothetical protein
MFDLRLKIKKHRKNQTTFKNSNKGHMAKKRKRRNDFFVSFPPFALDKKETA